MRSDFGAGLANPSELGGFEEFFEVCPSQASSSVIRTRAAPSSADNASISSSRCASRSNSSTTDDVSGTARSSTPQTTRSSRHVDHWDLTSYLQEARLFESCKCKIGEVRILTVP